SNPAKALEVVDTVRATRSGTATQYLDITGGGSSGQFITSSSTTGSPKPLTFNLDVSDGSIQTNNMYSFQLDGVETARLASTGLLSLFGNGLALNKTVTAGGTTGAQTINKPAGSVNLAAGATNLVVTDSLVTTSSIILCTMATNDAGMQGCSAVAGSG